MTVLFIHPPLRLRISGGNIYNRHIIQLARTKHYPLVSLPVSEIENQSLQRVVAPHKPRLLLWDSLFFEAVTKAAPSFPETPSALLIHYLPSENPSLDPSAKQKLRSLESGAIGHCAFILCTGSWIFRILAGRHPGKPLFVCQPGVDDFFQPAKRSGRAAAALKHVHLISVANLLPDKGYIEVLKALADLKHLRWIWHIVGSDRDDPAFGALFQSTANATGLMPRIRLHGVLNAESLAGLLASMDLFVSASRYEAYGMATAEAIAAGLPAVSTRTGDAEEMILDGDSGFLVPVGDRSAIRNALEKLIRDPKLRQYFRKNSLTRRRNSWQNCFEAFTRACDFKP